MDRTKAWALRIMMETMYWPDSSFVTLTYDDQHVPLTDLLINQQQLPYSLYKRDLQLFFKRLRKDLSEVDRTMMYYSAGEYGDLTFRPHYHFIGFGLSKNDEELILENWRRGIVDVGEVTLQSANYVAGYVQKKLFGDLSHEVYGLREPPFSLMSKGIGKRYFLDHWRNLAIDGYFSWRGKKLPLPRYFWKVMLAEGILDEFQVEVAKEILQDRMRAQQDRDYANRGIEDELVKLEFEERKRLARARLLERTGLLYKRSKI